MAVIRPKRKGIIGTAIGALLNPRQHFHEVDHRRAMAKRASVLSRVKVGERRITPVRRRITPSRTQLLLNRRRQRVPQQRR